MADFLAKAGVTRLVLANGCFDPLHVGHVRYLTDAAEHGDAMAVAVNGDDSARRLKGPGRPVICAADRAAVVSSLRMVTAVLIFNDDTVESLLRVLRPALHVKGTDYTVESVPERNTARELGIETVIAGDPKRHASRRIIARLRGNEPDGG